MSGAQLPGELVLEAPRRGKPPLHLLDLDAAERRAAVTELGLPAFRADQVSRQWLTRLSDDPDTWTDVPSAARTAIKDALLPTVLTPIRVISCDAGQTVKTVWRLHDGALVESVLMRYPDRVTMCISSQAGCGMNCPFCATGQGGLQRNMSTAEIVEQVLAGARSLDRGEVEGGPGRVSNIVFMGMGEPLFNFDNVSAALQIIMDGDGLGISRRRIMLSTAGVVPMIKRVGIELGVNLAISLHAVTDELRDELVPLNKKYPLQELLAACRDYPAASNARRITFEYVMLRDVNDSDADARELVRLLQGIHAKVNLIPWNPWPGAVYQVSTQNRIQSFARIINDAGYSSAVRASRGEDIMAACGQLKSDSEHAVFTR